MINKIIRLKEIASTHKLALQIIESNKASECVILAEKQTAGIGRYNRKWISSNGNLFASIIRQINLEKNISKISLAVACAIHRTLCRYIQKKNKLKLHWPNDIYYEDKKISGILIAVIEKWIVISIGVNIHTVPISLAISLEDISAEICISAEQLLKDILDELDNWICLPNINDFLCIQQYWLKNMYGINNLATIKNNKESLVGIIRGIDNLGRLILEEDNRNLYVSSGDMFINENKLMVNYE